MSVFKVAVVFVVIFHLVVAYRFRGRSPRCVRITNETAPMCRNLSIGYDNMMLPNLLDHDTISEVNKELAQWTPLVASGCHPYLKHFLCSVFAPVCMVNQPPIEPCRSLCSMVQTACEPLMRRYNYTWPSILNCSKYKQNEMCVSIPAPTKPPTPSVCPDEDDTKISPSAIKKKFCEAQFAFRGRVHERKERNGLTIIIFKVSGNRRFLTKNVPKGPFVRVRVPINKAQCMGVQKRKHVLVFGKFKKGKKMFATNLLKWKKKWRKRKITKKSCKKFLD